MYQKGADILTTAKQSDHKSYQTIMEHYIQFYVLEHDEKNSMMATNLSYIKCSFLK